MLGHSSVGLAIGCGSIVPMLLIAALFSGWVDPFLLSFVMFLVSFLLPVAIVLLAVQVLKSTAFRMRILLGALCAINIVVFVFMLFHKSFIWQWWLFPE